MLVEDDKSLREIYGVRLLAEGYDIVSAGDGEEALAVAIKERPTLIISDVMMPKISGFDMLDILRSTTETRNVKVIMMTALSSDEQRSRGEQLGADRYLVKSQVGIEDVVRVVHEVLNDAGEMAKPVVAASPTAPKLKEASKAPSSIPPQPVASANTNPNKSAAEVTVQPLADPVRRSSSIASAPSSRNLVIEPLNDPYAKNEKLAALIDKELAGNGSQSGMESAAEERAFVDKQVEAYQAQSPLPPAPVPSEPSNDAAPAGTVQEPASMPIINSPDDSPASAPPAPPVVEETTFQDTTQASASPRPAGQPSAPTREGHTLSAPPRS